MSKSVLWVLAILLAGAFTYLLTSYDEDQMPSYVVNTVNVVRNAVDDDENDDEDADTVSGDIVDENDDEDADTVSGDIVDEVITHDGYVEYSEDAVKKAVADGKNVALFFHATWCPTCLALEEDILENESSIGDDTVVFKVNYDTETELKDRYVVTSQHTIVYLDSNLDATTSIKGVASTSELLEKFE